MFIRLVSLGAEWKEAWFVIVTLFVLSVCTLMLVIEFM